MNVVNKINESKLCCGCGVCAGVCPSNALKIEWDNLGEYKPISNGKCNERCQLCLYICPVIESKSIDDISKSIYGEIKNINYDNEIGYYLNSYVGNVNDNQRLKAASGGLATWTMCRLLEENQVDEIITVGKSSDSEKLFEFKRCTTVDEVKACSSSAYYPVEISEIIKEIIKEKEEKTYAIMALPCVVYSIRKAQLKYKKLRNKIKFIFSLVCGQLVNKYCTEVLALESGVALKYLDGFNYRKKRKDISAAEFYQVPISNGKEINPIISTELPAKMWTQKFFTLESCNYCDDIFGELADAVFMDAWLPGYTEDWKGTTIVITRNEFIDNLYTSKKDDMCTIDEIKIDKVKKSQSGRIIKKREQLSKRITISEERSRNKIKRRVMSVDKIAFIEKVEDNILYNIQNKSKCSWSIHRKNENINAFWSEMKILQNKYKICRICMRIKEKVLRK